MAKELVTIYTMHVYKIFTWVSIKAAHNVLKYKAVEEKNLYAENGSLTTEITVSGDRIWKKRSFSSLYGMATVIGPCSVFCILSCLCYVAI